MLKIRFWMGTIDPLVAMTFTGSYQTFGDFQVTFQTPDKEPLLNYKELSENIEILQSVELRDILQEYILLKVATFPSKFDC